MAGSPLSIAHRGASGLRPENTVVAFSKALKLGASALEMDVQLTRDEVAVVIHDDTLERTTDGEGVVGEKDFAYIAGLDAGSWFAPAYAGTPVPALDEVLDTFGAGTIINLELKPDERVQALLERVVASVAERGLLDAVLFSSFDCESLRALRAMLPAARLSVLAAGKNLDEAVDLASQLGAETFNPHISLVDGGLVETLHARGLQVWVWTANRPGEIASLKAMGVDGIFSDFPDRVRG